MKEEDRSPCNVDSFNNKRVKTSHYTFLFFLVYNAVSEGDLSRGTNYSVLTASKRFLFRGSDSIFFDIRGNIF